MNYTVRVTRLTVLPENDPIFSDMATHVEIEDEAGGEFIVVRQIHDSIEKGEVGFCAEQWPHIRSAIETLMEGIKQ